MVQELWLFGEQYSLGVDDESLKSLLGKHVEVLGRTDITPENEDVLDLTGSQAILDLILYRRYPEFTPNRYEHLVIELKRPTCKLGQDEIGQIEKYAFAVGHDERFDKSNTRWTFLLIGNELDEFAETKCRVQGREHGHIYASDDGSVNIHVKKWPTIIAQAKWRYEFFREKLEYQVATVEGLKYLHAKHSQHLPDNKVKDGLDPSSNTSASAQSV